VTGRKPRVPTERIIECLRETNGLISLAAKRVPCSQTTIYKRARDVKAVRQVIDECRDELVDLGELALRSAIVAKEPWAVALVLKTLGRHRGYVERQEQEVSRKDGGDLVVKFVYEDSEGVAEAATLDDAEELD